MLTKVYHHAGAGNVKTQVIMVKIEDGLQMVSFSEFQDRIPGEGFEKFAEM